MSQPDAPLPDEGRPARLGPEAGQELPAGSPLDSAKGAMGVLPKQLTLPLPPWLGPLAILCAVGIIPWIVYLALTLPSRERAVHYDIAWVGFDAAMAVVLASLAYCALRRKPATGAIAAVAATMLVIDAWFDILTTDRPRQLTLAIISAVFAEIPLAVVCAWVAVNAERVRTRAYRSMRMRWERAVGTDRGASRADQPVSDPPGPPPPR